MRAKPHLIAFGVGIAAALAAVILHIPVAAAPAPAALSGVVSSQEEGKMEGVLVSARRDGATFSVTVVSDAQGRYTFPRSHLVPGTYALSIRAVGYDLADAKPVEVAADKP